MNIIDIIFLSLTYLLGACLLLFGILSFAFKYAQYNKLKKEINSNKIKASNKLRDGINDYFWSFKVLMSPNLSNETGELFATNKDLKSLHKRSQLFIKLQLSSLLGLFAIFFLYIIVNILKAWFFNS